MAFVKTGSFTVTSSGAAQNLNLGFRPSYFYMVNQTNLDTPANNEIVKAEWFSTMSNGYAMTTDYTASQPATEVNYLTSGGFTPYQTADGSLWTATNLTITGISKAAQAVVTATNNVTVGDKVSFHGVVGMTQINTLVGTVTATGGGTTFTVDIDSSAFSTYSSGGIANVIEGDNYQLSSGAQGNAGEIGLTLGASLMTTESDIWNYVAMLDTDTTS